MTRLGHYLFLGGNNRSIYYVGRWCKTLKRAFKKPVGALELRWYKRLLVISWIEKNVKLKTIVDY